MESECVLPPQVCGHPNGELTVKVEEIFWIVKSPGEIFVHLQWWGEHTYHVFWPLDLSQKKENRILKSNSVVFTLRTNPKLFENYLKNCKELTFYVVKETDRTILGTCVIKDLADILAVKAYTSFSSYYPIHNLQKDKIGDLKISISLFFKKKSQVDLLVGYDSLQNNNAAKRKATLQKNIDSEQQGLHRTMITSVLREKTIDRLLNTVSKNEEHSSTNNLLDFITGKNLPNSENGGPVKPVGSSSSDSVVELQSIKSMNKTGKVAEEIHFTSENNFYSDSNNRSPTEEMKMKTDEVDRMKLGFENSFISSSEEIGESSNSTRQDLLENKTVGKWNDQKYGNVENVDSLKFAIVGLHLSPAGVKKIGSPNLKPTAKQKGNVQQKPTTLFTVELSLPVRSVNKNIHKPTVFISKRYNGNDVKFGNSFKQKLPAGPEFPWVKVSKICGRGEIKVYWRHLNQRLPNLLGVATIPEIMKDNQSDMDELNSTLNISTPVMSNTKLTVGKLSICIELGRNGTAFGKQLFKKEGTSKFTEMMTPSSTTDLVLKAGDASEKNSKEEPLSSAITLKSSKYPTESEKNSYLPTTAVSSSLHSTTSSSKCGLSSKIDSELLKVIDVLNKKLNKNNCAEQGICDNNKDSNVENREITAVKKVEYKSAETNTDQIFCVKENLVENHQQTCCCCCKRFCRKFSRATSTSPININNEFELNRKSFVHEFIISVHKVVDFPLFIKDHDMDCFVDYKFPYINPLDGCLSLNTTPFSTETTIALRNTHFSTLHKHKLKISNGLTEALVTLKKQDLVFRLWGRTYQPVPRDHKLAKARLPLTKLTSLELKYHQSLNDGPFKEKLRLPFDLIRSSLTSGLHCCGDVGFIVMEVQYKRYDSLRDNDSEIRINMEEKSGHLPQRPNGDYFNLNEAYGIQRKKTPPFSQINLTNKYSKYMDPKKYRVEIPELDSGSSLGKNCDMFPKFNSLFDISPPPAEEPLNTAYIDLVDIPSPRSNQENIDISPTVRSPPAYDDKTRSHNRNLSQNNLPPFSNVIHCAVQNHSHTDVSNIYLHTRPDEQSTTSPLISSPPLHTCVELYSSQDPLQMKKDLSKIEDILSEEFEIISHPSFLDPKVERDFPPGICTNFEMVSISSEKDNPFEKKFGPPNVPKITDKVEEVPQLSNRLSINVGVETESQESENKSTQTIITETPPPSDPNLQSFVISDDWFMARVSVERAINLPLVVKPCVNEIEELHLIKPTAYVQFRAKFGNEVKVVKCKPVPNSVGPIWDATWQLQLPTTLLYKNDEDFELYVGCCEQSDPLGKVYVDLTALSAGLSSIDGWYMISDGIKSSGQIKVMVTPLEDISGFKKKWLEDYSRQDCSKTKHYYSSHLMAKEELIKDADGSNFGEFLHSSSEEIASNVDVDAQLAASLRSKISEMELLTEEIKKKISNKSSWDNSPPCSLLSRANKVMSTLEPINKLVAAIKLSNNEPSEKVNLQCVNIFSEIKTLTNTVNSPIVISDEEDVPEKTVIDIKKKDEFGTDYQFVDLQNQTHLRNVTLIDLTEGQSHSSQSTLNRLSSLEYCKDEGSYNTYTLQEDGVSACSKDSLEISDKH